MDNLISYKRKKWVLPEQDAAAVAGLARAIRCPAIIAQLLLVRGLGVPEAAAAFLDPEFKSLHSPRLLPNIDRAAERIARAVREREKIVLYGDYDVDGITGTTMLWHLLTAAGAAVSTYIPHRVEEGYGLNTPAILEIIDQGAQLIITIDCGISALEPIAAARERGVDVIVSDHHEIPATLPPAYAIVHPRVPRATCSHATSSMDAGDTQPATPPYPNPDLCGAGVAFKLAWAVAQKLSNAEKVTAVYRGLLLEFSALAALGTIADVVPLVGENRILVKYGLAQLARTTNAGLLALIDAAGFSDGKKIDTIAVGFSLAPRLNAAGRMGHAREAVELLTTAAGERCVDIATWLESQNRDRQATERTILANARAQIDLHIQSAGSLPYVIVVKHETFHAGVVGIVASRIVDQFHRPTFVLATDAPGEAATAHGSARSIPGFELHVAIEHCRGLLLSGGGHAMAGGVKLALENLSAFTAQLNAFAASVLTPDHLIPALCLDGQLSLADCSLTNIAYLEKLEPYGRGNPHPRFLLPNVRISAPPRRVGNTGSHLQLQITDGRSVVRCIAFGMGDLASQLPPGTRVDLVVEPKIDRYNPHSPRVDLQIADLALADGAPLAATISISPSLSLSASLSSS